MSFGFNVGQSGADWERMPDGTLLRTVTSAELIEISPVTWAAYPQTTVGVRNDEIYGILPEIPVNLRARVLADNNNGKAKARARNELRRKRIEVLKLR